ncbi:hypothetical protein GT348_07540 [Aristophania vespae]|uniref:Uncharacterized protein n=1 Tax=Aristophania vespae TaxID=2697033 RepID=A0A6P1NEY6_9PROT|nr:glycosyltransferase [Aristophania vespae]QHI96109.1 hypothetical protein GT348_07540 [Aristophania vespae]UMM63878.1 hypothetical protein DM15PD_08560 [Aristophania vespae]
MFVSFFNSFLAITDQGLEQKNFCAFHDEGVQPVSLQELKNLGFQSEYQNDGMIAFRKGNDYLSVNADLSLSVRDHVGGWERFSEISETKLPPFVRNIASGCDIPKIIHQIGYNISNFNPFYENINYIKYRNKDYDYKLWTKFGNNSVYKFIYDYYGIEYVKLFEMINQDYGAMCADLARYMIIYAMGGVYLDLKSVITQPLNALIKAQDKLLLAKWESEGEVHPDLSHVAGGEYVNWFIASIAGHSLLRRVINQVLCNIALYDRRFAGAGRIATLRTTGPVPYTRAILSSPRNSGFREISLNQEGCVYQSLLVKKNSKPLYGRPHYSSLNSDLILKRP